MSLLNRPSDGLLSVLLALRRAILAYGPQPEDRLVGLCAPASVVPGAKPDMARRTLTRWRQLGFFQQDSKGRLTLSPEIATIGADDTDGLRAALLRLILDPTNNATLIAEKGSSPEDDTERSLGSDFTRAACWTLAQDPYRFTAKWRSVGGVGVERLQTEQSVKPVPFVNDVRWQGFEEWAAFVGIAWKTVEPSRLVLDPSFAIRSVLPKVFDRTRDLDQRTFLARLAQQLPILDDGQYRTLVQSGIEKPWRSLGSNEISPCLSVALLHLEENGRIELQTRADAAQKLLLGRDGRELRPLSHIHYSQESRR